MFIYSPASTSLLGYLDEAIEQLTHIFGYTVCYLWDYLPFANFGNVVFRFLEIEV